MTTVFVTGAGGGIGQGIIKALRLSSDLDIRVVAADMSPLAAGLYAADLACTVPAAAAPGYVDALIERFLQIGVDFYFPGTDVELQVCADHAEQVRGRTGARVVVAPAATIRIAADKYRTYEFLQRHGLAAPATFLPQTVEPLSLAYPVVVKPRRGCRSQGFEVVEGPERLVQRLAAEDDLVVQELIGSDDSEYTCTVVGHAGWLSEPFLLRRWLRDGDTYRATPVRDAAVSGYVSAVAEALEIEGPCNLQLRVDDGQPKLLEVNARCSGTTPLWAQLGFNPVECYLKAAMGLPFQHEVRYEATVLRYWAEVVVADEQVAAVAAGDVVPAEALLVSRL